MNTIDKTSKEELIRYTIGCLEQYLVSGFPVFRDKQKINQAIKMLKTINKENMTQEEKEKDLCYTCEHYWLDFPMPLDRYIPHCEITDEKIGWNKMDETIPYPCLKCPFDSYKKKQS